MGAGTSRQSTAPPRPELPRVGGSRAVEGARARQMADRGGFGASGVLRRMRAGRYSDEPFSRTPCRQSCPCVRGGLLRVHLPTDAGCVLMILPVKCCLATGHSKGDAGL